MKTIEKRTAPNMKEIMAEAKKLGKLETVPLDWNEVYYTNCPLVSASNVDQELGWTKEAFKKIGVNYQYLRAREDDRFRYIGNRA